MEKGLAKINNYFLGVLKNPSWFAGGDDFGGINKVTPDKFVKLCYTN